MWKILLPLINITLTPFFSDYTFTWPSTTTLVPKLSFSAVSHSDLFRIFSLQSILLTLQYYLIKISPKNIKWKKSATNTSHYSIKLSKISVRIHLARSQQQQRRNISPYNTFVLYNLQFLSPINNVCSMPYNFKFFLFN